MVEAKDKGALSKVGGSGLLFFSVGIVWMILGVTDSDRMAFTGIGVAFMVIGMGMVAKARKAAATDKSEDAS